MSMSQVARDRILGALFLLSLAGILLPMWFDGAGVQDLPELNPAVTPTPTAPVRAPMQTTGDAWSFSEPMASAAADGPLGAADAGERSEFGQPLSRDDSQVLAPGGAQLPWTVQVASVSALPAGKKLKDQLLAAGYHAYIVTGTRGAGIPTVRVSVGPIVDRGEAERVRAELRTRFGLQGILKRFDL